jgi:hypothetical protein
MVLDCLTKEGSCAHRYSQELETSVNGSVGAQRLNLGAEIDLFIYAVKALNEIKSMLGWRVVYSWVGDDPCGHGDLPPWSGVTCSQQGDYRVVTEL